MSFGKEIEEIKNLCIQRDVNLFGFWSNGQFDELSYKIQKLVSYLFDGSRGYYQVKKGWLFIKGHGLNIEKIRKLGFFKHKDGYVKKIFNEKNEFIFKIG